MNPAVSSGIIIYLCHKPEKQWGYEDEAIGANAFLTAEEVDWLAEHGAIRMGYQDNYLAFCAQDKSTGELNKRVYVDALNKWEEIRVAKGVAVYDPKTDPYAIDTVRRADKIMYQDKRARKGAED